MAAIIVVLSNILIGQISFRYEKAVEDATVQSDIAKAKIICKIEKSRFVWRVRLLHFNIVVAARGSTLKLRKT